MSHVFLSYSSLERSKAETLRKKLEADGHSVWIDVTGIDPAVHWESEISKAIENCSVFILLVSRNSVSSHNVLKEVTLASELKKQIIPVNIENVDLPHDFRFQLAGLQHVGITEINRIRAAVKRILAAEAHAKSPTDYVEIARKKFKFDRRYLLVIVVLVLIYPLYQLVLSSRRHHVQESMRTVAVLPFDNSSIEKATEFFADGLTGRVISDLNNLGNLHVTDRKTMMQFKGSRQDLSSISETLGAHYVVTGNCQKQGRDLIIGIDLIDMVRDSTLWSEIFQSDTTRLFETQARVSHSISNVIRCVVDGNHEGMDSLRIMKKSLDRIADSVARISNRKYSPDVYRQLLNSN